MIKMSYDVSLYCISIVFISCDLIHIFLTFNLSHSTIHSLQLCILYLSLILVSVSVYFLGTVHLCILSEASLDNGEKKQNIYNPHQDHTLNNLSKASIDFPKILYSLLPCTSRYYHSNIIAFNLLMQHHDWSKGFIFLTGALGNFQLNMHY